jgi:hypothetical protein
MTSVEVGTAEQSNATNASRATFGSVPSAERFAANSIFKLDISSARKSFGAGLVPSSGAGAWGISFGMIVSAVR